ncbi:protein DETOXIFICATION 56 [Iris pallida]|uniref:Protein DETOXIFICATION n=1 Tax=Iris pallida TaxID=29817 RepID=A0AAX6GKD1_IRIPA|nr:protein DETOXIFICATION 56 [Iris pallida]
MPVLEFYITVFTFPPSNSRIACSPFGKSHYSPLTIHIHLNHQAMSALVSEAPTPPPARPPPPPSIRKRALTVGQTVLIELRAQRRITIPLAAMNLTWFAKTAITTVFLGRLGGLSLSGGILGFTFANVTGFSVLVGLCGAMEPICGQGHGAGNRRLLRKTLLMAILLLLSASLPISFLWINVDKILLRFGQQRDIANVAKKYTTYLLPDLVVASFLSPLKAYLSSQEVTLPTLLSSAVALALHIPLNIVLARARGIQGVAMAIWLSDLATAVMLAAYVYRSERKIGKGGGWWDQRVGDWVQLLRLAAPCCLTTCLEWWCWEILVLLTGRLPDPQRAVAVAAVVLNFDYLLYSIMLSLATCASVRVSNELGAGRAQAARDSAYVSLGLGVLSGFLGALATAGARGGWGSLFSHDEGVVDGARKMMRLMALVELVNFPLAVCGGIVRGTAAPWVAMCASLGGFYLVALPLGAILAFRVRLGLGGLLLGFLAGATIGAALLVLFVALKNWEEEAAKAEKLAGASTCSG